jgi:hypothetical protein
MNARKIEYINHGAPRRSACAALSREQETARLRSLSVEQRIRASLAMRGKVAWLKPAKVD